MPPMRHKATLPMAATWLVIALAFFWTSSVTVGALFLFMAVGQILIDGE